MKQLHTLKQLRGRWGTSVPRTAARRAAVLCTAFLLTVSLAAGLFTAYAASVPDPTADFYVNDYAGVLSDTTKNEIIDKNDGLYAATGAQIVVTVVQSTGGASMSQYVYDLANTWGIGSAEKDNGVLLLLSIDDDDYQCIQGSGLETLLPTTTLSRILQEDLEPDFAAKDYDAGVRKTFASLYDAVCEIYSYSGSTGSAGTNGAAANTGNAAAPTPAPSPAPSHTSGGGYGSRVFGMVITLIVFLVVVVILISIFTAPRRRRTYYGSTPTYRSGSSFGSGFFWGSVLGGRRRPPRNPPPPPPGGWGGRPSGPRPGGPVSGPGPGGTRPPIPPRTGSGFGGGSFGSGLGGSAPRKSSGGSFGGSSRKTGGFSGSGGFGGSSRSGGGSFGGSSRGGFGGASRGGFSGGSRGGGGGSFRGGGAGRGH